MGWGAGGGASHPDLPSLGWPTAPSPSQKLLCRGTLHMGGLHYTHDAQHGQLPSKPRAAQVFKKELYRLAGDSQDGARLPPSASPQWMTVAFAMALVPPPDTSLMLGVSVNSMQNSPVRLSLPPLPMYSNREPFHRLVYPSRSS